MKENALAPIKHSGGYRNKAKGGGGGAVILEGRHISEVYRNLFKIGGGRLC